MIETTQKCPECGDSKLLINKEKGEIICKSCGSVIEDSLVDFGKERAFDEEDFEKKNRTGAPFDPRIANNIVTEVGNSADFHKLPANVKKQMYRIREKNKWVSNSLDQNLNVGLNHIKTVTSYLNITDIVEKEAARIYRLCAERGITRYTTNENLAAACVFISSRVNSLPKTLGELQEATGIKKKVIAKTYKMVARKLNIKIMPNTPFDFLNRFASELKLDPKIQTRAVKLINQMFKKQITSGKNPTSLAATALYIASLMENIRVTQRQVVEVSGITETTLRSRVKEMLKELGIKKSELKRKKR
ncbi:hypothetical protein GF336_00030 [Candidatus Woesearchaeota archaeon]|nr:hypothetical protein [Candidatus Woesearchaeota archaeon]